MKLLRLGLLFALALPLSVHAEWLLKPRVARAISGETVSVDVWQANDKAVPINEAFPATLQARVFAGARLLDVLLYAADNQGAVIEPLAPGTFRKREFRFALPEGLSGLVTLALEGEGGATATLVAERPGTLPATAQRAARPDTVPEPAISPHEPMYFLVGTSGGTTAKFQLSMKYRLLDEDSWAAGLWRPLGKLHFGYTQTSIWDLAEQSAPFRDTSYRPSLFYFDPHLSVSANGSHNFALAGGLEHESNGRDGTFSRSINTAFIKPSWQVFFRENRYFAVSPKFHTYLDKKDNADIDHYRGNVDLNLRYGRSDGWLWSATMRKGSGGYGSLLLDASWPLRQRFFANAGGFLHLQYFNGYGETLLDYNVRHAPQWRVGFSIVR